MDKGMAPNQPWIGKRCKVLNGIYQPILWPLEIEIAEWIQCYHQITYFLG